MSQYLGRAVFKEVDSNGDPLNGGKLYAYEASTSTPKNTYPTKADADAGTNPNSHPVILDSDGAAQVWMEGGAYKFNLTDANDVQMSGYPIDDIYNPSGSVSQGSDDEIDIQIPDDTDPAFRIYEPVGADNYIEIETTDGSEKIKFGNTDLNPDYDFLGTGDISVGGNINIESDNALVFGDSSQYSIKFGTPSEFKIMNNDESYGIRISSTIILEANDTNIFVVGAAGISVAKTITMSDGENINCGSTSGMKIGTSASQKLGFWNTTPAVQPSHIASLSLTGTYASDYANIQTAVNAIIENVLETIGLAASS